MTGKTCIWHKWVDPDGGAVWNTACGEDFMLIEGEPTDNLYNFCPNCGGKLLEAKSESQYHRLKAQHDR